MLTEHHDEEDYERIRLENIKLRELLRSIRTCDRPKCGCGSLCGSCLAASLYPDRWDRPDRLTAIPHVDEDDPIRKVPRTKRDDSTKRSA